MSDGPEGDVTYHLQVGDGEARFGAGAAEPEHVRMEQTWDTAVAVATGDLNAQEAFVNGHIRLYGDQQRLLDAQPVFGALDAVFNDVRRAHRVRLSRRARAARGPGPRRAAHRRLRRAARCARFVPLTFTALKTAVPAPDEAYGLPLVGGRPARQVPARARSSRSRSSST